MSPSLWLILVFQATSGTLFDGLVFTSEHTPRVFSQELAEYTKQLSHVHMMNFSHDLVTELAKYIVVFDYTHSVTHSFQLRLAAAEAGFLLFTTCEVSSSNPWVFCLHSSLDSEASALSQLLSELHLSNYYLLASTDSYSRTLAGSVSSEATAFLSLPNGGSEAYHSYVSKTIKPSGNWRVVGVVQGEGASTLTTAMADANLFKSGSALVCGSRAVWGGLEVGTVLVVEEGLELAESQGHYEVLAIERALTKVNNLPSPTYPTSTDYYRDLLRASGDWESFSVVNVQTDKMRVIVGSVESGTLQLTQTLQLPDGSEKVDEGPQVLRFSANSSPVELDGTPNASNERVFNALTPMVTLLNEDDTLLSQFTLEMYETDCGAFWAEYDSSLECFTRHFDELGFFYLQSVLSEPVMVSIDVFRDQNISIPNIGLFHTDDRLFDKDLYPEVIVSTPKDEFKFRIMPSIIESFGWKNIVVFVQDIITEQSYKDFLANAERLQLNILNSSDRRVIRYVEEIEVFVEENTPNIQHAYETGCTVFILLLHDPNQAFFAEALHRLGVEDDQITLFCSNNFIYSVMSDALSSVDVEALYPLLNGALSLNFDEYIGEEGQTLKEYIEVALFPSSIAYTGYLIESLMLGVHAIDMMLTLGKNYEDPYLLNDYIRIQNYLGNTGQVSIDSDGNGRGLVTYVIYNFYQTDDGFAETEVGTYRMGITVPLKFTAEIQWTGDLDEVPPDMREMNPECGFFEHEIEFSFASYALAAGLSASIFVVVATIVSCLAYSQVKRRVDPLEDQVPMKFEDGLVLIVPVCEALQYIGLGPSCADFNDMLARLASLSLFELSALVEFGPSRYWNRLYLVFGTCLVWVGCVLLNYTRITHKLPEFLSEWVYSATMTLMPLFTQILFVPFIATLFSLLRCERASGPALTDAFLEDDCTQQCWTGTHLLWVSLASVCVAIYAVVAISWRPVSERLQQFSYIKHQPLYLILKGAVHLSLLVSGVSLRDEYPVVYYAVFVSVCTAWTVYLWVLPPSNYLRYNLWIRLLMMGVVWHCLALLVMACTGEQYSALWTQLIGWGIIALVGVIVQRKRYPSQLIKAKDGDIAKLFRFQLSNKVQARDITVRSLDYVYRYDSDSQNGSDQQILEGQSGECRS